MNRFLRVSFAIGMIYTFLSLFTGSITGVMYPFGCYAMLWLGTLLFLISLIIPKLRRYDLILKIIGVIIAVASFVFIAVNKCPVVFYVVNAALTVSCFVLVLTLKYNTIHRDFAAKFKFTVIAVVLVFCLVCLLTGGSGNVFFDAEYTWAAVLNSIPSFIIAIVMGILLLRGLRASVGIVNEVEFNKRQLRDTVVFFSGCLLITVSGLPSLIVRFFELFAETLINPLILWIDKLIYNIGELLVNRNPPISIGDDAYATQPAANVGDITPAPSPSLSTSVPYTPSEDKSNEMIRVLMVIFGVIIAAIIIYIVVGILLKRGKRTVSYGYPYEESETIEDGEEKREKQISRRSRTPRLKIRYYYLEFLRSLKRCGGKLSNSHTCEQVADMAKSLLPEHDREIIEFSDVYRKARYNLNVEPTPVDVKRAKQLFNSINKRK